MVSVHNVQELKTHEFGIYKKKVAQLMTVAREKDIAEQATSDDAPSLRDRRRQEKCGLCPPHVYAHVSSSVANVGLSMHRLSSTVSTATLTLGLVYPRRRKQKVALGFGQF